MTDFKLLVYRWMAAIGLFILLLIIVLTLAPFNFLFADTISPQFIINNFRHASSLDDWLANILLYFPLGFSLACFFSKVVFSKLTKSMIILVLCFGLSATVEILQVFLPSRVPSSIDIYANCLGSFLGVLCFDRWGYTVIDHTLLPIYLFIRIRLASLPIQNLMLILIGYISVAFFLSVHLQTATNLNNWTQIYPLLLGGNSLSSMSSWQGYISEVSIAERAISEQEVVKAFSEKSLSSIVDKSLITSYQLTPYKKSYSDQVGTSPKLIWRGSLSQPATPMGAHLNANQWLVTEEPVSLINQKLRKSSQFTFDITLATADIQQVGPVPIIGLSTLETDRRNFGIAQNRTNLVIWLRTSVTGSRGVKPELIIPDVFTDTTLHHLVIAYEGSILHIYVDQPHNVFSFELNPGVVLFQKMLPLDRLSNAGLAVSKALYYAFLFIPLGVFIGLIVTFTRRRFIYRMLLVLNGALLAPYLLEVLLTFKNSQPFDRLTVLLGAITTICAMIITCMLNRVPDRYSF